MMSSHLYFLSGKKSITSSKTNYNFVSFHVSWCRFFRPQFSRFWQWIHRYWCFGATCCSQLPGLRNQLQGTAEVIRVRTWFCYIIRLQGMWPIRTTQRGENSRVSVNSKCEMGKLRNQDKKSSTFPGHKNEEHRQRKLQAIQRSCSDRLNCIPTWTKKKGPP